MENSYLNTDLFAQRRPLSLLIAVATISLSACGGGGSSDSQKEQSLAPEVDKELVPRILEPEAVVPIVEPQTEEPAEEEPAEEEPAEEEPAEEEPAEEEPAEEEPTEEEPTEEEPTEEEPAEEEPTEEEPTEEEPAEEEPTEEESTEDPEADTTFDGMTEEELRAIAPPALDTVPVPQFSDFGRYIENVRWARMLGKALFWDQSTGSDGVTACASCHFKAGTDNRSKNQLSPGLLDRTPGVNPAIFNVLESGNTGGPNYQLLLDDFPFPKEVNDVVSSQGVFNRFFNSVTPGEPVDDCTPNPDEIFHVNNTNTRRVEPRNTPTTINAIFNHRNFWDGRASNVFNGFDAHGARSNSQEGAGVWSWSGEAGSSPQKVKLIIENASLASQSLAPPISAFESSCNSRSFPNLGRKLLSMRALLQQEISTSDSLIPAAFLDDSGLGLTLTYAEMIRQAFKPEWWGAVEFEDENGYSQMEANFSLFWGLAIQLYEATLVSDQSRYDAWAKGENVLTEEELDGLAVFLDPERGNCAECHGGAEFTVATVSERAGKGGEAVERMTMADGTERLYDGGFYNIGVRQTLEDVANGGETVGSPICFARQLVQAADADDPSLIVDAHFNVNILAEEGDPSTRVPVQPGEKDACDGAFKSSTLRNIELTAPYFHNGGTATLEGVMRAYQAGFDGNDGFAEENIDNLHPSIPNIDIGGGDRDALVSFMLTLTDERVRHERAPFDHPSLCIVNGHTGNENAVESNPNSPLEAQDEFTCLPAVGAEGLETPQPNFLGLVEPVDDGDDDEAETPENDEAEDEGVEGGETQDAN